MCTQNPVFSATTTMLPSSNHRSGSCFTQPRETSIPSVAVCSEWNAGASASRAPCRERQPSRGNTGSGGGTSHVGLPQQRSCEFNVVCLQVCEALSMNVEHETRDRSGADPCSPTSIFQISSRILSAGTGAPEESGSRPLAIHFPLSTEHSATILSSTTCTYIYHSNSATPRHGMPARLMWLFLMHNCLRLDVHLQIVSRPQCCDCLIITENDELGLLVGRVRRRVPNDLVCRAKDLK